MSTPLPKVRSELVLMTVPLVTVASAVAAAVHTSVIAVVARAAR